MSYGQVLPLIGPEGGRIHEIARLQRVSRQAISATTLEIEALGYLRREPDPRDRRSIVLVLTNRGAALIRDSVAALDGLERRFRVLLGQRRLESLRAVARELYRALRLEAEIFETPSEPRSADRARGAQKRARGGSDIERLATRLRSRLGSGDAARLAALLDPPARKTAP
jgi:DNA-binding MarR family transcriptional regulator